MMMSSVVGVKFVKTKVFFRYYTKVFHVQIPVSKLEKKRKSGKNNSELQNGAIKRFQIGAKRLQSGAGISNRGKEILQPGQILQIGSRGISNRARITNRSRDYKSVQNN